MMAFQSSHTPEIPDTASGPATITFIDEASGRRVELPLLGGTLGPSVIDIRKLYSELGYFTYDPGFTSTASCESRITFIDGV